MFALKPMRLISHALTVNVARPEFTATARLVLDCLSSDGQSGGIGLIYIQSLRVETILAGNLIHLIGINSEAIIKGLEEVIMSSLIYLFIAAIGITFLFLVLDARIYARFRGTRVVICPETRAATGVIVDAWHAAATGIRKAPELRLQSCSRWPERAGCDQACIRQIEAAADDCLLRNILSRWYLGKDCALCTEPFGEIHWADHKPAFMNTQGKIREWKDVLPEEVFAILDTHLPVCWRCSVTQTFCQEHSDLVLNRSRVWPPTGLN
jgi:hypothetical protein